MHAIFSGEDIMADDLTSITLLNDLQDPGNQEAWLRFVQRYQERIRGWAYRWCLQRDLPPGDAQEVAEEIAQALAAGIHTMMGTYDVARHSPGGFRCWLRTSTHNALVAYLQRRARERGSGDSQVLAWLNEEPARADLDQEQHREFLLEIANRAAATVRRTVSARDWSIVEALGFEDGRAARWEKGEEGETANRVKTVAHSFGLSASAVLKVKSRVIRLLRTESSRLLQENSE